MLCAGNHDYPMTLVSVRPHLNAKWIGIDSPHAWKSLQQFTDDAAAFEKHTWVAISLAAYDAKHVWTNFYGPNVADLELIVSVIRLNRI